MGMRVRCLNQAVCEWTGELRSMSGHLRKECALEKLIHSTQQYVESTSSQANAVSPLAATQSAFPLAILSSLPLPALYRLASFHSLHVLAGDEMLPRFQLRDSGVMRQYQLQHYSAEGQQFDGHAHVACSADCIRPPLPRESSTAQISNDCSAERDSVVQYLYDILTARREQSADLHSRLFHYLSSLPSRTLQQFLSSKGLPALSYTFSGVEKGDLVRMALECRGTRDTEEWRRMHGADVGRAGYRSASKQVKHPDDAWREVLTSQQDDEDHGGGFSGAGPHRSGMQAQNLVDQLHAAALAAAAHHSPGLSGGMNFHTQQHFQHHALHAAQHMALGFGNLSVGLGNGVVLSMRVGGVADPSPASSDPSSRMFANAMAQHQAHVSGVPPSPHTPPHLRSAQYSAEVQARAAADAAFRRAEQRRDEERQRAGPGGQRGDRRAFGAGSSSSSAHNAGAAHVSPRASSHPRHSPQSSESEVHFGSLAAARQQEEESEWSGENNRPQRGHPSARSSPQTASREVDERERRSRGRPPQMEKDGPAGPPGGACCVVQ